jgi:hypothetical protein
MAPQSNGHLTRSVELAAKLSRVFRKRAELARDHFMQRARAAAKNLV